MESDSYSNESKWIDPVKAFARTMEAVSPMAEARALIALRRMHQNWSRRQDILRRYREEDCHPHQTNVLGTDAEQLALDECSEWKATGIHLFTPLSGSSFPPPLRQLFDCPPLLFGLGNPARLAMRAVAIVGSRSIDISLARFTEGVGEDIAARQIVVVSGLARGADAAAHRGALAAVEGGSTIAVLGHGFGSIYPAENRELAARIVDEGGLLLSEYEPGMPAFPQNFLARNRIIAGLAELVVVVQAAERSGSLVTARQALELGRSIAVVPGSIVDTRFSGSHRLIRDGAELVTSSQEVLEALKLEIPQRENNTLNSNVAESWILRELKRKGAIELRTLCESGKPKQEVELELLQLELTGLIERQPGNWLRLRS